MRKPLLYGADLARIHDEAFSELARRAAPRILTLLRVGGVRTGRVVELGAGGGQLAAALVRAGYEVHAFDRSAAMVRRARANVPDARFAVATLPKVALPPCDAVVALGEVLNYLPDAPSVRELLRRIARALRPDGLLLFDVVEPSRAREVREPARISDSWALFARVVEDPRLRRIEREITTFVRVGNRYRRSREVHRQRTYPRSDWLSWLTAAGFKVRTLRTYGGVAPGPRHVVFFARKR